MSYGIAMTGVPMRGDYPDTCLLADRMRDMLCMLGYRRKREKPVCAWQSKLAA